MSHLGSPPDPTLPRRRQTSSLRRHFTTAVRGSWTGAHLQRNPQVGTSLAGSR